MLLLFIQKGVWVGNKERAQATHFAFLIFLVCNSLSSSINSKITMNHLADNPNVLDSKHFITKGSPP